IAGSTVTLYKFVALAADGFIDNAAGAQGDVNGICGEGVTIGDTCPMVVPDGGVAKVMAGAAVSVGDDVACDASGRAIAWVDAAGNVCLGTALGAATVAGEIISIQFYAKKVGAGS
ncbi:MAG: hypothetical protein DRJ50_02805, partial [Actinobacteria bacterium]